MRKRRTKTPVKISPVWPRGAFLQCHRGVPLKETHTRARTHTLPDGGSALKTAAVHVEIDLKFRKV